MCPFASPKHRERPSWWCSSSWAKAFPGLCPPRARRFLQLWSQGSATIKSISCFIRFGEIPSFLDDCCCNYTNYLLHCHFQSKVSSKIKNSCKNWRCYSFEQTAQTWAGFTMFAFTSHVQRGAEPRHTAWPSSSQYFILNIILLLQFRPQIH